MYERWNINKFEISSLSWSNLLLPLPTNLLPQLMLEAKTEGGA